MKTKEELNALKEEVETQNKKLHELDDEQLAQVAGGVGDERETKMKCSNCGYQKEVAGYHVNETVTCPICKQLALTGQYVI